MSGLRKESVRDAQAAVPVINEALEDLGHGIDDARVRQKAAGEGVGIKKMRHFDAGELTVGASATIVRHNLGVVPLCVVITMRSVGTIYETTPRRDSSRVWLQADAAGRKAHVVVFG